MADYYPLIARAVEGLSDPSPEMRRAVYERARSALIGQLRTLDPPLTEDEIHQERISLDEAIRRIESEYAAEAPASSPMPQAAAAPVLRQSARLPSDDVPGRADAGHRGPFHDDGADDEAPDHAYEEAATARPRVESRPHPGMQNNKRTRTIVLGAVLALAIAAIAAFAFLWRDRPEDLPAQTPVAAAPQEPAPDAGKINERVGGGQAPPATNAPAADAPRQEIGVAQRAVFYEEDPANPQTPKAQVGRVVWRLEDVNPGQGQALEKAVTANVEVPDAGLSMRMVLRRNLDSTLPASHTVELTFTTRAGESGRVIRDVGLLQFKNEEAARGTPIAGLPVPVRENLFLIGLSNLPGDIERNTELFVRRNWIDLPVRMASGQRAILSFEKGPTGERVMNEAFTQWQ
ncbi:histidine kinase [Microvirga lenta]|uniref:histidine kinase n=1 Tax=Microvirga lenta TaxID=2881337 RepID=UPI001CFF678A|nr:histidine kinase [Microvirga lenta]MCB5177572.1 histidine kinase [Microvirga lenta]